jgi:DNA-binding Lrp family transcriptional regulator
MKKEDLKEKFKRIFRKTPRARFEKVNLVFESIKNKQDKTKLPSTIAEISSDISLKRNSVRTYVKHLEKSNYIKRYRKYTPPFLKVTDKKGDVDFIYGKENRDNRVEEEQKNIIKTFKSLNPNIGNNLKQSLRFIKGNKNYNSKFLSNYNKLVEFLWKKNKSGSFVKLEIGSGANRFFVY